jgi:hypothetical protein
MKDLQESLWHTRRMAPHITCQTILVPATPTRAVEQGFLIFADNVLMAVVMHLQRSVDDPDLRGLWFLETGYGPCAEPPGVERTFRSPDEAQQWVLQRVSTSH